MPSYSLRTLLFAALVGAGGLLSAASFANAQATPAETQAETQAEPQAETQAETPVISPSERELAETRARFKRCAEMQDVGIRMQCYDSFAVELGYVTPDRAKAIAQRFNNIGMWQVTRTDDGYGNILTTLRNDSLNTLTSRQGVDRHVSLIIRCIPGKTEAMIDWKAPVIAGAGSAATKVLINYNTNNSKTKAERWDTSTDHRALFAPDAIAFARNLMNEKTLSFGFGSVGTTTANIARFNIQGVETALDEIVKSCYDNKKPE